MASPNTTRVRCSQFNIARENGWLEEFLQTLRQGAGDESYFPTK